MRMMSKNNKGVTLVVLIITIVVLMIVLSITVNYGVSELRKIKNKKTESDIGIVQEAVMQRYALVKASNQLGIKASSITKDTSLTEDNNRPSGLVGTRLYSSSSITTTYGFPNNIGLRVEYASGANDKTYEQYYYLLSKDDLKDLGVDKNDTPDVTLDENSSKKDISYIVNYSTGEVFDITNKKYYDIEEYVYKQPTDINMENKTYDYKDD